MALTPWLVTGHLEIREAAALLAGIKPTDPGLAFCEEDNDYNHWRVKLVQAAMHGELEADWANENKDELGRAYRKVVFDPWPQEVWAWIRKPALHQWLIKKGIPDSSIPLEIRTYSKKSNLEYGSEGDSLRALEALGLLAETFAKQAPRYQINEKPNRSQIAEAMSAQAGEVSGMGKRKLQDLLTDALDAWEKKRG